MVVTTDPSGTGPVTTTIALIEQFLSNVSPGASRGATPPTGDSPSPLLLLNASAKTLKAQVTKVSLLTVTAPFTATAVLTCLKPLNDSILPSLVTATLLTTSEAFTPSFSDECHSLTRAALRELLALARLVDARSRDGQPAQELGEAKKKEVAEATGRVWDDCDEIATFSDEGIAGFMVRKAQQWLDLMKDAVKELSDWDPEEEADADDMFEDAQSDDGSLDVPENHEKQNSANRATISGGVRDQALKVLSRIPQSVHVVIKQRLGKLRSLAITSLSSSTKNSLDIMLKRISNISELIDESAEGMYVGDLEACLKKAGEARSETVGIVESALQPFQEINSSVPGGRTQEDKYVERALRWIKQVDTAPPEGNDRHQLSLDGDAGTCIPVVTAKSDIRT